MPVRIQRRRSKGWRMPENTISVTRPGKWGNPFRVGMWAKIGSNFGGIQAHHYLVGWVPFPDGSGEYLATAQQAVDMYRRWLTLTKKDLSELQGKNLACFCPIGQPCHADVLLELANREASHANTDSAH